MFKATAISIVASALLLIGCDSRQLGPNSGVPSIRQVSRELGVSTCQLVRSVIDTAPGRKISIRIPIDGEQYRVNLEPHSVRAPGYRLLVQDAAGVITERRPGPVETFRGTVSSRPRCRVAGAMLADGLHLVIRLENGSRCWLEPVPAAPRHTYAMFDDRHVLPTGGICPMPGADDEVAAGGPDAGRDRLSGGDPMLIARLACDTDTEFVAAQGSPSAAEARINAIINAVNLQYESQVGIRHEISTILIRTSSDPYTASDVKDRLCQFITEWTTNRSNVDRDVAHLFTGSDLRGGTIGIAADIGGTGICVSEGSCRGGRFGTRGSYCLSQSDFSGAFACVTDLTAHELGHLWGAFHCTCPSSTMNAGVTCTNTFSGRTIRSILRYRDTRDCLEETAADN